MSTHIGPFSPPPASGLALHIDLDQVDMAWEHCGRTADLVAQHVYSLLAAQDPVPTISHDIAYVANELIENAWKFNAGGPIHVSGAYEDKRIVLHVSNSLAPERREGLTALVRGFEGRDPGELLVERIEENLESGREGQSGLGFITLMADYGAELGWCIEADRVTVSARFTPT
ncbi:MAG: ATP-binding protein [Alphaproteobacteria bacterium]|nr:ATP-binding protein [Alphaproteobacteria bacterium]MCB9796549.1 ATP-binding protein [Alphaproteobacteria bacterium]